MLLFMLYDIWLSSPLIVLNKLDAQVKVGVAVDNLLNLIKSPLFNVVVVEFGTVKVKLPVIMYEPPTTRVLSALTTSVVGITTSGPVSGRDNTRWASILHR